MNILVIGTIDNRGGAAMISWELRKRLKSLGHTVNTFVRYKYSNEPDVFVIPRARWQDWLVRLFANDLRFARTGYIFNTKEYREADIIHCHNLHSNFFNLKDLVRMSNEKPVVWTMHDLWALTGFASDSVTRKHPNKKRFLLCLWDRTPALLRMKEKIYERSKLTIVAVSDWMKRELEKSILKKQKIIRIYNGVDTGIFKPGDKEAVRRELGLPLDKKIVAFGTKGIIVSMKVADAYAGDDSFFFVAIGHAHVPSANKNIVSIPYIQDKATVAKYLGAADAFLYPTQGDSFGLLAAESLSCGAPVVTTDVDALPEIVAHQETGYVARPDDTEDLKAGLEYVLGLSKEAYAAMSRKAVERIREKFSLERMCEEYLELYKSVSGK